MLCVLHVGLSFEKYSDYICTTSIRSSLAIHPFDSRGVYFLHKHPSAFFGDLLLSSYVMLQQFMIFLAGDFSIIQRTPPFPPKSPQRSLSVPCARKSVFQTAFQSPWGISCQPAWLLPCSTATENYLSCFRPRLIYGQKRRLKEYFLVKRVSAGAIGGALWFFTVFRFTPPPNLSSWKGCLLFNISSSGPFKSL